MKTAFALALGATSILTAVPALAQEQATDAGARGGLEEIVVTAQKREENLQKVPVAVTALSSDALASARVANIRNLSGLAPSLQVTAQGQQSIPLLSIRGISSGSSTNSVDPKIGLYLDGVYIGRTVGAIFDMADIERVEVLRGPQGTLFGRNATGGAISLITAAPTGEFGVKHTMSYGNYDAFRSRTVVDLPALGPLKLKVSYLHDEMEGDVRNPLGGKTLDVTPRAKEFGTLRVADRLGGRNVDSVQVTARVEASDQLTLDYRFDYTDSRSVGRGAQLFGPLPGSAGAIQSGILAYQAALGGITNQTLGYTKTLAAGSTTERLTVQGHSLTLNYDVSDEVSLKSITAYRRFKMKPVIYDLAATGGVKFTQAQFGALLGQQYGDIMKPANLPRPNDYFYSLLSGRATSQKQFTQEFQLNITQDKWNLVAGAFYFREKAPSIDVLGIFQPIVDGVVVTTPLDKTFGSGTTRTVATRPGRSMRRELGTLPTRSMSVEGRGLKESGGIACSSSTAWNRHGLVECGTGASPASRGLLKDK